MGVGGGYGWVAMERVAAQQRRADWPYLRVGLGGWVWGVVMGGLE